jgi:hypothetical protein
MRIKVARRLIGITCRAVKNHDQWLADRFCSMWHQQETARCDSVRTRRQLFSGWNTWFEEKTSTRAGSVHLCLTLAISPLTLERDVQRLFDLPIGEGSQGILEPRFTLRAAIHR